MEFKIQVPSLNDVDEITSLYKAVAAENKSLARREEEINKEYVKEFIYKSLKMGIMKVIKDENNKISAEIHAYRNGLKDFSHLLTNLTIAVHPAYQGKGLGKMIFTALLDDIKNNHTDILRVELITRNTNAKALQFYEKLGFKQEGLFKKRVIEAAGNFVDDIQMAWFNPDYNK